MSLPPLHGISLSTYSLFHPSSLKTPSSPYPERSTLNIRGTGPTGGHAQHDRHFLRPPWSSSPCRPRINRNSINKEDWWLYKMREAIRKQKLIAKFDPEFREWSLVSQTNWCSLFLKLLCNCFTILVSLRRALYSKRKLNVERGSLCEPTVQLPRSSTSNLPSTLTTCLGGS